MGTRRLDQTRAGVRGADGGHRAVALACLAVLTAACQSSASEASDAPSDAVPAVVDTGDASDAPGDDAVAVADAYWQAIADGDGAAAVGLIDPAFADIDQSPGGRAETLEGQLRWYEAVGFRWTSTGCIEVRSGVAECTASAVNDWSEALGVEPVTGKFRIYIGDAGITYVVGLGPFAVRWNSEVFAPFSGWVWTNHPEDAAVMWGPTDVNDEILELFAVNTRRFVDAQG